MFVVYVGWSDKSLTLTILPTPFGILPLSNMIGVVFLVRVQESTTPVTTPT